VGAHDAAGLGTQIGCLGCNFSRTGFSPSRFYFGGKLAFALLDPLGSQKVHKPVKSHGAANCT